MTEQEKQEIKKAFEDTDAYYAAREAFGEVFEHKKPLDFFGALPRKQQDIAIIGAGHVLSYLHGAISVIGESQVLAANTNKPSSSLSIDMNNAFVKDKLQETAIKVQKMLDEMSKMLKEE